VSGTKVMPIDFAALAKEATTPVELENEPGVFTTREYADANGVSIRVARIHLERLVARGHLRTAVKHQCRGGDSVPRATPAWKLVKH